MACAKAGDGFRANARKGKRTKVERAQADRMPEWVMNPGRGPRVIRCCRFDAISRFNMPFRPRLDFANRGRNAALSGPCAEIRTAFAARRFWFSADDFHILALLVALRRRA